MYFEEFEEEEEVPSSFECPLCGAEVEESGYCEYCKESVEDDNY